MMFLVTSGTAQQPPAGGRGGRGGGAGGGLQAPPPILWPAPPLPDGPIELESAEQRRLRISVTKGLVHPWSLAFLPDGSILVTERGGHLRIIRQGVLDPTPVGGVPQVAARGLSGLLDIALHPRFAENRLIYLSFHKPLPNDGQTVALARGTWNGSALTDVRELFAAMPPTNAASRLAFGRDGMIYMTVGGPGGGPAAMRAQDPNDHAGKLLRLREDGTVPNDNPFVGRAGYRPEIFSLGHRNQLALAVNPETGALWAGEQGPNGGDEINIIQAGRNYGWPVVSYGREYLGPRVSEKPWQEGMEQPVVFWVPSIALSGMTFYTGDRFPSWKGNVFVGGLRVGEVPRTGHLERIVFNEKWEEIRRESLLTELKQRIRDVRQGPDGLLYVLTEENEAALLRIEPAGPPTPGGRASQ
jgi:glucose/arabinose dehydrogenase